MATIGKVDWPRIVSVKPKLQINMSARIFNGSHLQ
jgi:hypothetical protein